jgi:hypothetical protein
MLTSRYVIAEFPIMFQDLYNIGRPHTHCNITAPPAVWRIRRAGAEGQSSHVPSPTHAHDDLQIKKRGAAPLGGGEVQFLCPIVKSVNTLNFVDPGKIKRIRGIAYVPF